MANVTRTENLLQIGDDWRIESGPRLVRATATAELLSDDVTAPHYSAPRPATDAEIADPAINTDGGEVRAVDALGKPILIGEPMAYLDWKGVADGAEGSLVWYVYHREPLSDQEAERGHVGNGDGTIFREVDCRASEEEALAVVFERGA